ncbi:uncharacterized protein LOC123894765 isoform X2 [Trifolium pratense]|uniref:Uncharacterized protein n=1 Tax=Trifolium pratense TaxID=57577 RepID=A0ACB0JKP7_TRIPR|nr:uncharacterized protein LOC123894765 isoform X2 [Trifolium pratense]CAJ2644042.1 unnamed protein product [Trifolium pratense]
MRIVGSKLLIKGVEMGFFSSKEEKSKRILRVVKTLFFLITMILSLLLFSAPVLLVIADALVPSALLSTLSPFSVSPSLTTLSSHFQNYDFRYSLIDIPLVSIIRSFIIFCVYSLCDGPKLSRSRGPYLGITTLCSVLSLLFVSFKAVYVFGNGNGYVGGSSEIALFVCSCVLAVGHVVVAYRTSCRERRKLLVYKIDIEAISACTNKYPRYPKIHQEERIK